ncbi:hypothetical protein A1O1_08391 [Capronia coronata CBS 617.96]|uniref:Rad21/Rec8-like protein N-terminal domain-containing protein n=1 Tax=Capronia coronata CBS 617.96 TaxID=1182541 RepID=W9YD41_9EURO|nr:uncharacterized protein A1O1_08391 [Capronia coronata CBS 617.96]EXJ80249.1 hypothetical protein A1O1_08391 [Capronia coronata CBS 617.96]
MLLLLARSLHSHTDADGIFFHAPSRLVATLGSKSTLKKVTRRAILDVDLPKACQTITEPVTPLALRLQSDLLFGVSRVFSHQCGYVLADVTSLRDKMRVSQHVLRDMELDPDVGKMRPEQLNLAEDPYFIPDLDINFDLTAFGLPSDGSMSPGLTSLHTLPSSQSSQAIHEDDEAGLEIPSLDTPGGFGMLDVAFGAGTSSVVQTGSRAAHPPSVFDEEPAIIEDPMFDVDDDGLLQPAMSGDIQHSDTQGHRSLRLASESVDAERDPADALILDDDVLMFGDDDQVPAEAPPVTPRATTVESELTGHPTSSVHPDERSEEISETVDAPQRRARPVKALRPDQRTELSNRDLNDWNDNYLLNMAAALHTRLSQTSRYEAKRNAEFWALHQGIGNVATTFADERVPHPFGMFSGHSLWDLLRGPDMGAKRSRSSSLTGDDYGDEDARRVRARTTAQEEIARGDKNEVFNFGDDDGLILAADDFNLESEVGRHAPPSLPDRSSGMPWNISGSRQSSAQPLLPRGSGLVRLSSSAGGLVGGMELGPPSAFGRRGSRFTSASPLLGKGPALSRHGSQEAGEALRLSSIEDDFADLDAQLGADVDVDFELYGPSANVDTQTAAQSQWIAETLENEAHNFLTFVNTKIQTLAEEDDERDDMVTFNELLPPTQNSQIVGAQALLHVLALATKGLLEVSQAEPFAEIEIAVVSR